MDSGPSSRLLEGDDKSMSDSDGLADDWLTAFNLFGVEDFNPGVDITPTLHCTLCQRFTPNVAHYSLVLQGYYVPLPNPKPNSTQQLRITYIYLTDVYLQANTNP